MNHCLVLFRFRANKEIYIYYNIFMESFFDILRVNKDCEVIVIKYQILIELILRRASIIYCCFEVDLNLIAGYRK